MSNQRKVSLDLSLSSMFVLVMLTAGLSQDIDGLHPVDTLPLDPVARHGRLSNGFTYYLRKNNVPNNDIEMFLVVKAGFMHEDEDQLELAHLLEHMAFRSTIHFPDGIVDYLEKEGLSRSVNFNATAGTRTTYRLFIPGGNASLLNNSLLVLRDWANGLLLKPGEIDAERGAVLQEIGMGATRFEAFSETRYAIFGHRKFSPAYLQRHGENVKHFKHESLYRFYRDWYRPDLQAVVIVGDIDLDHMERQIAVLFSDLKNPQNSRQAKNLESAYSVPLSGVNRFVRLQHENESTVHVQILRKRKGRWAGPITVQDYKRETIDRLHNEMMADRFKELNAQGSAKGQSVTHLIERGVIFSLAQIDALATFIQVGSPTVFETTFKRVMTEIERVRRYGFTQEELIRAKEKVIADYRRNKGDDSRSIARKYVDHFENGTEAANPEFSFKLRSRLIKETTLGEVNGFVQDWLSEAVNMDILILAAEDQLSLLPTDGEIMDWIDDVRGSDISPFKRDSLVRPFIEDDALNKLKGPGTYSKSVDAELGITTLELQNGVQVILKPVQPATNEKDLILLHGFSPGGTSLYTSDDLLSAIPAAQIVNNGGLGNLNQNELNLYKTENNVKVSAYISKTDEGIQGTSSVNNLESMLKLIFLYFVAPTRDTAAFNDWLSREKVYLGATKDSRSQFNKAVVTAIRGEKGFPDAEVLEKADLDKAYNIFQDRFADASDFTFVVTGNFDTGAIESWLTKYLGSLPSLNREEKSTYSKRPKSTGKEIFTACEPEKTALVRIMLFGEYQIDEESYMMLNTVKEALQIILLNRLRAQEGSSYGVTVSLNHSKLDRSYDFQIVFDCDPDKLDYVVSAVLNEISRFRDNGPDRMTFMKAMQIQKQALVREVKSSKFWLDYLVEQYRSGSDPGAILNRSKLLDGVVMKDIRTAARKFMLPGNERIFIRQ